MQPCPNSAKSRDPARSGATPVYVALVKRLLVTRPKCIALKSKTEIVLNKQDRPAQFSSMPGIGSDKGWRVRLGEFVAEIQDRSPDAPMENAQVSEAHADALDVVLLWRGGL